MESNLLKSFNEALEHFGVEENPTSRWVVSKNSDRALQCLQYLPLTVATDIALSINPSLKRLPETVARCREIKKAGENISPRVHAVVYYDPEYPYILTELVRR